jgi:hypothetical protein
VSKDCTCWAGLFGGLETSCLGVEELVEGLEFAEPNMRGIVRFELPFFVVRRDGEGRGVLTSLGGLRLG